ncbi:major outer membrane protein [Helicobacter himalayensis]|uniref:major outer membrane protein n=1 Tax=Helicobacter himalayensis TaxID=1591088 RepID=UPI00082DF710|nr:major outer membrane protein [Helicobacter himalayensis]
MNTTFKLSLAALTALGTLSSASAMSFLEALEGTSISSTTFVRYTEKTGLGDAGGRASGSRFQVKSYLNFLTQDFEGYQAGFGLYYNQGSGMPLSANGNSAHTDLLGTGASHLGGQGINANLNIFGVSEAFLNKKFDENGKYSAKVGMMYLKTPFTDGTMDRGVGASTAFQFGNTTLKVAAYDSWSSMDWAFMRTLGGYGEGKNLYGHDSFKNNLFYIGAEKPAVDGSGLDYKLYLSAISRMINAAAYLDLGYNTGGFRLGAQVAYTQFGKYGGEHKKDIYGKGNALVYQGFGPINASSDVINHNKSDLINPNNDLAKNAGLYNIQASYASKGSFMLKAGFTGSFGDSYGALIDNQGAFNLGGMVWHNMLVYGGNGASMFGSGGVKGTNIMVGYAKFVLDATEKLKLGIDVAYVGGANNIHGNRNNFTSSSLSNKNTNFIEITPSLVYKLNERFTFTSWYGQSVGDMKLHIARAEVKFAF